MAPRTATPTTPAPAPAQEREPRRPSRWTAEAVQAFYDANPTALALVIGLATEAGSTVEVPLAIVERVLARGRAALKRQAPQKVGA